MSNSADTAPNYDYLLKLDHWSKKDAALIICEQDPEHYRSIRFSSKDITEETAQAYNLFKIFVAYDQCSNHQNRLGKPCTYLSLARNKDWEIPNGLCKAYSRFNARKNKRDAAAEQRVQEIKECECNNGARVRKNILKIIGALTQLYKANDTPNPGPLSGRGIVVADVVEDIMQLKEDHDLQITGLGKSNLHNKISEALKVLGEEYDG